MAPVEDESSSSTSKDFSSENDGNTVQAGAGIGLSNPNFFQRERMMLDLINRMHNTG